MPDKDTADLQLQIDQLKTGQAVLEHKFAHLESKIQQPQSDLDEDTRVFLDLIKGYTDII